MTPEYQLAADLTALRGDCQAQIKRLEREIAELRAVHRLCARCPREGS